MWPPHSTHISLDGMDYLDWQLRVFQHGVGDWWRAVLKHWQVVAVFELVVIGVVTLWSDPATGPRLPLIPAAVGTGLFAAVAVAIVSLGLFIGMAPYRLHAEAEKRSLR